MVSEKPIALSVQYCEEPRSTEIAEAVMHLDSSEASQHTVAAISSAMLIHGGIIGVPMCANCGLVSPARCSAPIMSPVPMSVATGPGCTLLTRIACLPSSAANARAIPVTACLLAV